jgi:cysteine desulfurase
MGLDSNTALSHLRFSLGIGNSDEDVDYVLEVLPLLVRRLRDRPV